MDFQHLLVPPDLMECKSVLCIQPHPDDNEIGAGAVIAKLVSNGCRVTYLTVTNGDLGSSDPNITREEIAEIRNKELQNAGKHLGVSEFYSLGYGDGSLENVNELALDICDIIRKVKPDAVLCPDPWLTYEAHSDHRITGLAVSKAVMASGWVHLESKSQLKPWKNVQMVGYYYTSKPNTVIDVTDFLQKKFEAMALHESQMGDGYLELYQTYFTMKATEWAEEKGFKYGEGLKMFRPLHLHCFLDAEKL